MRAALPLNALIALSLGAPRAFAQEAPIANDEVDETQQTGEAPVEPTPVVPAPKTSGLTGYLDAGWGHRSFYAVPANGGTFEAGIGGFSRRLVVAVWLEGFFGTTSLNLATRMVRFGAAIEWKVSDRWRVGGTPCLSFLSVTRATDGSPMNSGGFGATGHLSFDVWQPSPSQSLYAIARISGDYVGKVLGRLDRSEVGGFGTWGSTLGFGYRFQ